MIDAASCALIALIAWAGIKAAYPLLRACLG
jgi:hypothetical protein